MFRNYRKLGRKEFMNRLKTGMMKINPQELLRIRLFSLIGQAVALTLSVVLIFILSDMWFIAIAIGFAVIFTLTQVVETYQQYKMLKMVETQTVDIEKMMKGIQEQEQETMTKITNEQKT